MNRLDPSSIALISLAMLEMESRYQYNLNYRRDIDPIFDKKVKNNRLKNKNARKARKRNK